MSLLFRETTKSVIISCNNKAGFVTTIYNSKMRGMLSVEITKNVGITLGKRKYF